MGDRTWIEFDIKKTDQDKVAEILNDLCEENRNYDNTVTYFGNEINYGGSALLDQLADMKINFMGEHGPGGNYGSMAFACFDRILNYMSCNNNGDIIISVLYDQKRGAYIDEDLLKEARHFFEIQQKVKEYFKTP